MKSANFLKDLLRTKGIEVFDIVASPLGTLYFEWYTKEYSVGISISETFIFEVEIMNTKTYKTTITKYYMHNEESMNKFFTVLKELKCK